MWARDKKVMILESKVELDRPHAWVNEVTLEVILKMSPIKKFDLEV